MSSCLTVYNVETQSQLFSTQVRSEIQSVLREVGILFESWPVYPHINGESSSEDILAMYQQPIQRIKAQFDWVTVDVIAMTPKTDQKEQIRQKFLQEHTHSEDEIRFFVDGQGLFSLHLANNVYSVLCTRGDLISVPKGTPHWFDMGSQPDFKCIRFFKTIEGWVANYSGTQLATQFPTL